MATFANTTVKVATDGQPYANPAKALPSTEADLNNQVLGGLTSPVPCLFKAALIAEVQLTIAGGPSGNTSYVVLQTDLGDNNWLDVAWIVTTSTSNGTLNFFLSAGVGGANAVQQSRANGTAPGSNGSVQIPLGARIRFTGQATLSGGTTPSVTALINYKFLPLQ